MLGKTARFFAQTSERNQRRRWHQKETRGGDGTPLQYSCLENPMDRGAWQAAVHGVTKSRTLLSDFTSLFYFHAVEEMATHSSVLAWRIPGKREPGGLLFMGSHRARHDWSDLAAAIAEKKNPFSEMERSVERASLEEIESHIYFRMI